jgi:hypothetical protein
MSQVNSVNGNTLLFTGFFPPCRVGTAGSTIALSGLVTLDGIALNAGDRVLVKDQADQTTNGIYAASSGNWVRTSDAMNSSQFFDGMGVMVSVGAQNAATLFLCTTTDDPVIIGTSLISFVSLSTINTVSATMRPVVQANTLAAARTALGLGPFGTASIGAGLQSDGASGVRANSAITNVSTTQFVSPAFDLVRFVATAAINFNLPQADTLWNGFGFWIQATGGDVTLVPNNVDTISGAVSVGASFVIPNGATVFVTTDAAVTGNWYVSGIPWLVQQPVNCSGTRNIVASDNAKILVHNSGAFGTFIFPAASTLPSNFRCLIINGETGMIGKGVGGTNLGSFTMYPGQSYVIIKENGTMQVLGGKQPFSVSSLQLFADASSGSDNPLVADGLASGTRAYATQNNMQNRMFSDFLHQASSPVCTCNGTFTEAITFRAAPPGAAVVFWNGSSPGAYTINEVGGVCWIIGDGAVMECANVHWEGNNNTSVAIQMHQTAILDILSGCTFGNMGGNGVHVGSDGAGFTFNIDAGYTIENGGNAKIHWSMAGSGVVNVTGSITITINGGPAPVMSTWTQLTGPVLVNMGSGITFSGGPATGAQKWAVQPQAWLSTAGNTIPGSSPGSPTLGSAPTAVSGWVS